MAVDPYVLATNDADHAADNPNSAMASLIAAVRLIRNELVRVGGK